MSMLVHDVRCDHANAEMPFDVRVAIEWVVSEFLSLDSAILATVIGDDRLVAKLCQYAKIGAGDELLISLAAEPSTIVSEVARLQPATILTLIRGPLWGVIAPFRARSALIPEMGYTRKQHQGFLGPQTVTLLAAERIARLARRDDIADRFRIAAQRSARVVRAMAVVTVNVYGIDQ
jgi:hypothetical protein